MKRALQNKALNRIKTLMNSRGTCDYHIDCQAQLIEDQPTVKSKIQESLSEIKVINAEITPWLDALLEEEAEVS